MSFAYVTILVTLLGFTNALPSLLGGGRTDESTLELVHVVFRHGDRNPDQLSLYPSNPYYNESFYPEGFGQLTDNGKRTEYKLGVQLRTRYNEFLGNTWNINLLDVRTTDVNRTKMSVELMLAGLWPPTGLQIWLPFFFWQPIPYYYLPLAQDKEVLPFSACARRISTLLNEVTSSEEISSYLERYNETIEILQSNTGINIDATQAFYLYFGFLVQEQLGLPLEDWTEAIYPEPLHSLAIDYYYLETNTTALRRILAGYFLKKVLSDTKSKINGTLTPSNRKVFIYSAHETNVATVLLALDAFQITEVPPYGSYVLFEVHNIDGVHGIKIFYQNYEHGDPKPVKIRGCDYFCPYDDFYSLVEEILPESDEDCYGS